MKAYPQRLRQREGVRVIACLGDTRSADPVVRATAATTTPDLAAIAAIDAALAAYASAAIVPVAPAVDAGRGRGGIR